MAMETLREKVMVLCYWNGSSIKYGPDGVYYEGSTPKKIRVKRKTALSTLLNGLYPIFGLDKQKSEFKIFGRCPVVVSPDLFMYVHLPVVNDTSLETMLEIPSNHPFIKDVELYVEVTSTSRDPAPCSSPLENPGSSSKRQRTQEATGYVTHPSVKVERDDELEVQGVDNNNRWIEDDAGAHIGNGSTHGGGDGEMTDKSSGLDGVEQVVNLTADNDNSHKDLNVPGLDASMNACLLNKGVNSSASKPLSLSSLWVDDHELRVGLCFKDRDELKKAVGWCSIRGRQKCVVRETEKDEYTFECIRWKCNWSLRAVRMEEHGLVEITKCSGPHTCCPIEPENFDLEFVVEEIECLIRVQPTLTIAELKNWWFEKFGSRLKTSELQDLNGKYPMKLMIAQGLDADDCYFPLAFAVTKEVSTDCWRWFLTVIREKVTQRKDLCLISSPHPDIVAVVKEPGSLWQEPWAYHRFCLDRFCTQFHGIFRDSYMESLVKQAGSTSQKEEFYSYMKDIEKKNSEARKWLDQFPQSHWAWAHDSGRRYGNMTIETESFFAICESFQSLGLPVTATALLLFDEMRLVFYRCLCDSSGRVNCGDLYTKPVMDTLEDFMTASVTYVVMPLDKGAFQVTEQLHKDGWIVRLSECTCTCGEFQLNKFPCLHALAVCEKLKINPLQYVDEYYTLERLHKTYAATFSPVPEVSAWPEASGVPTLFPPVIPPPPPPPNVSEVKRKKCDTSPKESSKRKRIEEQSKSASKEKPVQGKGKDKTKEHPSDEELRNAVVDILKWWTMKRPRSLRSSGDLMRSSKSISPKENHL